MSGAPGSAEALISARDWVRILAQYRKPKLSRSLWEIGATIVPFIVLWTLAYFAMDISVWLTVLLCIPAGGFLVRLFMIQHDCGHAAMFESRTANDWVGRVLGVLTLTPYDVWRRAHSMHHSAAGNLDKRGVGDIHTLTVREYHESSRFQKLMYRAYRNPITLFLIGPIAIFGFFNRLPLGSLTGRMFWASSMGTNLALVVISALLIWLMGFWTFALIFGLTSFLGAAAGVWLFYVQHQFEEAHWDEQEEWDLHDAALYGSSHYDLPAPLRWMTGNIGVHHVHHLYSRIPFYRLSEVLRDHPLLGDIRRLTLWESFGCINLHLWDENQRRMVNFAEARALVPVPVSAPSNRH